MFEVHWSQKLFLVAIELERIDEFMKYLVRTVGLVIDGM